MPTRRLLLRGSLLAAALAVAGPGVASVATAATPSTVRVMTFNIAHLRADPGGRDVAALIRYYAPQIVLLNEVDGPNDADNQAHELGRALRMQARAYLTEPHGGQRRGNAILIAPGYRFRKVSKAPLRPDGCYKRGVLGATVDIGPRNVNVGVAHLDGKRAGGDCPNDPAHAVTGRDAALEQAKRLRRIVGSPACPTFVGGDMNRQSFESPYRVLTTNLRDAWTQRFNGRAVNRGGNDATYGWAPGGDAATRIDYLFFDNATPTVADVPRDGEPVDGSSYDPRYADSSFPSDHKPVVTTFRVASGSCRA